MVRIVDDGSHFDAPLDKVWKLVDAHNTEISTIHPEIRNVKIEQGGENQGILTFDSEDKGQTFRTKLRITVLPPFAQAFEALEGPMTGSKFVNYYTPKGNKTGVTVIGDFESPMIPPAHLEGAVHEFLDNGFNADSAYLKKMR